MINRVGMGLVLRDIKDCYVGIGELIIDFSVLSIDNLVSACTVVLYQQ